MNDRVTFNAYDTQGFLKDSTWANSAATIIAEKAAYQMRLNRGELSFVEVLYIDEKPQMMYPNYG